MKNLFENLKKNRLICLIPVTAMTLVAFVLSLVAVLLYGSNCGSEFNGGVVSANVTTLGTVAVIISGITLLVDVAAFFLAKNEKLAYLFSLSRIGNYAAFVLLLGAFFFQILDEYSLIGTILYPIVSGAVGDPVDPTLSTFYFTALIFLLIAFGLSLASGVVLRKKSHKIIDDEPAKESEGNSNE